VVVAPKLDDAEGEVSPDPKGSPPVPQAAGIGVSGGWVRPRQAAQGTISLKTPASTTDTPYVGTASAASAAINLSSRYGMVTQQQQGLSETLQVEPLVILTFQTRTRGLARRLQEEVRQFEIYLRPACHAIRSAQIG